MRASHDSWSLTTIEMVYELYSHQNIQSGDCPLPARVVNVLSSTKNKNMSVLHECIINNAIVPTDKNKNREKHALIC